MKTAMALFGILSVACANSAVAEMILIDWATTTPIVTDSDGNKWNSIGNNNANPNNAALIDSSGGTTPVTVSVTTGNGTGSGWDDFNGAAGPDPYDEPAVHDEPFSTVARRPSPSPSTVCWPTPNTPSPPSTGGPPQMAATAKSPSRRAPAPTSAPA